MGIKVKIGNKIYDSEKEPIAIIMNGNEHVRGVINNLAWMNKPELDKPVRVYVESPKGVDVTEFMKSIPEKWEDVDHEENFKATGSKFSKKAKSEPEPPQPEGKE